MLLAALALGLLLGAGDEAGGPPPGPEVTAQYLGEFRVTYYWVAVEEPADRTRPRREEVALRDVDGRVLARVLPGFRRALDREGTGQLADGRVLNVARRVGGEWRYVELEPGALGLGSTGAPLEPFRSAAADPTAIAPGSWLYLPDLHGIALPDGSAHSGYLVVADQGSAITANRLDVFIARAAHLERFEERVPSHGRAAVFLARTSDAACGGD